MDNVSVPFIEIKDKRYSFTVDDTIYRIKFKHIFDIVEVDTREFSDRFGENTYEMVVGDIYGFYSGMKYESNTVKSIVSTIHSILDDFITKNEVDSFIIQVINEKRSPTFRFFDKMAQNFSYKSFEKKIAKYDKKTIYCYHKQSK